MTITDATVAPKEGEHAGAAAPKAAPRRSGRKRSATPARGKSSEAYERRTPEKVAIGERLRIAREAAGMSQAEAARKAGYTAAVHLSQFETGSRMVTLEVLMKLVKLYGTTADYVLGFNPDIDRDPAVTMHAKLTAHNAAALSRLTEQLAKVSVDMARKVLPEAMAGERLAHMILEVNSALQACARYDGWDDVRGVSRLAARINAAADAATVYAGQMQRARRLHAYRCLDADVTGRPVQIALIPEPEKSY